MSRPTCTASAGPSRGARTVTVSGQARLTLEQAFERFESTVTTDDRRLFQDTRLEHVRNAALEIEQDLATRRSLRNMRRLQPFLQGLEHYSKAIEVLCNGTPYLSWIWAPVKLMLQITSDHLGAFEKLIEAYGKIGDALPRFDRLSAVLKDDHNFQAVLALMYADVLEFHRRAYKFVRRRGWKFFFSSMWDNFDSRFKSILADLAYHSDLVDKEAVAVDIAASLRYQKEDAERFEKQEQEWKNAKLSAALSWLGFGNHVVDHIPDNLTRDCSPGACDWIFKHAKMEPWLQDQGACSIVWLCGKPGAGKSVLTASLVHHLEELSLGVYCYFCSYSDPTEGASAYLFRSLVAQIIQIHPDAAIHVAEKYINSYRAASNKAITCLLPELLDIVGSSRLVIDGIDEWDPKEQQIVMDDILTLATGKNSTYCCKVIISSRDMPAISSRIMRRNKRLTTVLSLSEEQAFIDQSIQSFIDKRLDNYRGTVQVLDSDGSKLSEIRRLLVTKSNGMFLWVKLVLDSLEFAYTPEDLRQAVVLLPSDLTNLYKRILRTICGSPASQRYIKVVATLQWIAFACRPIKMNELLHGLAHASGRMNPNSENIPVPKVLELCKPLVEQRLDGTVSFIHFSVQEYLQSQESVISGSAEAHHIISSTCVATLSRGLELLHPDLAVQSRMITITRGVYGLMMYSLEFWQHHVLSYAEKGGDLSADSTLTQSLLTLCSTHERIQKAKKRVERSDNVVAAMTSPTSLDVRLPLIKHPAIHELLYESLQLRHASKEHSSLDGKAMEKFALETDRTLFSELGVEFEGWILYLLSQTTIQGLADDALGIFQLGYANYAFHCRYPFCRTSSIGFATAALRRQHETSHLTRTYCSMTSCPWNRIGFNDEIALRHHTRIHHSKDNPRLAPAKARLLSPAASVDLIRRQDRSNLKDSRLPTFSYKREKGRRTLAEDYLDRVSPNHVRQGGDWFAFFEPHQPRVLDIELVHTLPHERVVFSVSFSSCGLYLATGSYRAVSLYDVATGTTIQKCTYDDTRPDLQYVRAVRFHPDSTKIISGGEDGAVRVWDFSARQCQKWKAHELFIRGLDIGNNGNLIATGSEDRTVRLWTSASEETNMFSDYNTPNKFRQFDLKVAAMSVSISPDCRVVAAGLVNGVVCVWDIATGSLTARLTHDDTVYGVAFNPSSSHIISGSRDKTVKYWELDPNMQQKSKMGSFGHSDVQVHEGHDDFVMETTMTPDAPWLISGSEDKSVRIVDADTGALQCIIVGHTGSVLSVQCSPTGEYFATGSHDETVRIWQYKPYVNTLAATIASSQSSSQGPKVKRKSKSTGGPTTLTPQKRLATEQELFEDQLKEFYELQNLFSSMDHSFDRSSIFNGSLRDVIPDHIKTWAQLKQWALEHTHLVPAYIIDFIKRE